MHLGPYEILGQLGVGGMGEVYRAHDPHLQREVAVKVLPEDLANDPERLRRFRLEGRAASALNHPNLLTVFHADVHEGIAYLVTELLEGQTLHDRLEAGPLPIRQGVGIAAALARGLAAAHDGGIVHRDLKPGNIFLMRDERVKILDFGLARVANASARAGSLAPTQIGIIVGTPGYMSPEQVSGEPVDHRSDIFSLGCVLHEMLTGRPPFLRATAVEMMTATLRDEPPEPADPDGRPLPGALVSILRRCLEKSAPRRYQSAADLAFQLESVGDDGSRTASTPRGVPRPGPRVKLLAGLAGLAVLAAALGAAGMRLLHRPAAAVSQPRTTFLTFSGHDTAPDASPDGDLVVFTSIREGVPRVYLKQLATSEETAVTDGPDRYPRLSPDGATVLFTRLGEAGAALYRVPVLGGPPRKVVDAAEAGDFSPDARRVVFTRVKRGRDTTEWLLMTATVDGSDERQLGMPSEHPLVWPRWSPAGTHVAVVRSGRLRGLPDELLLVETATGQTRALPRATEGVLSAPGFVDGGRQLVYAQSITVTAYAPQSRLVSQDVATGDLRTLAWIPTQVTTVDGLADGTVVLDGLFLRQSLREFPLGDATPGRPAPSPRWLTRGSAVDRQPVYSPDGVRIVFSSSRSGNLDLWALSPGTGMVRRITEDAADDWDPALTKDGRLLWSSNRGGRFEVWAADPDGRRAHAVTKDGSDAQNPSADPSGAVVTWVSGDPRRLGLWRAKSDGSDARPLVSGVNTMSPEISPDGRFVLYHTPPDPGWCEIRVVHLSDGSAVPFRIRFDVPGIPVAFSARPRTIGRARWMPDGKAIAFVGLSEGGLPRLFVQPFDERDANARGWRPLVVLPDDEAIESFAISPDGTRLAASIVEQSPSLMVVDGLAALPVGPRRTPATPRP